MKCKRRQGCSFPRHRGTDQNSTKTKWHLWTAQLDRRVIKIVNHHSRHWILWPRSWAVKVRENICLSTKPAGVELHSQTLSCTNTFWSRKTTKAIFLQLFNSSRGRINVWGDNESVDVAGGVSRSAESHTVQFSELPSCGCSVVECNEYTTPKKKQIWMN